MVFTISVPLKVPHVKLGPDGIDVVLMGWGFVRSDDVG